MALDLFESIKNTTLNTYRKIKKEAKNFFDGTVKKIFSPDPEIITDENGESPTSLAKHVEELHQTIESSKIVMAAIIEKIRYEGKIKILNELNGNPQHPAFQSSFPDLFTTTPKPHNQDNVYPFKRIDENFDLQGRKNISKVDENFKLRMGKSIQELYFNNFIDNHSWQVSNSLNSSKNIISTVKNFQKNYEELKLSHDLDKAFMMDFNPSLFIINKNIISLNNKKEMIKDFKEIIPDIQSQKLISTYANQNFLHQSYLQFIHEHPEITQYQIKNSRNTYKVNNLDDGSIKLVATNLSDLNIKNENHIEKYKSFGIRATIILSPNHLPIMKYSHFLQ